MLPCALGGPQVGEGAEGVEPREVRRGQPSPRPVQPERAGAGEDTDAVPRPHGRVVGQALGVVPHPVAVDQPGPRVGDRVEHRPVDVGRDPGDHVLRGCPQPLRPEPADQVGVRPDAPAGDHDRLGGQLGLPHHLARGRHTPIDPVLAEHVAAHPGHGPAGEDELGHPVPPVQGDQAGLDPGPHLPREGLDDRRAGAPDDVEPRHRVAVAGRGAVAAFGPADHREEPDPPLAQPGPLLPGGPVDVGAGPSLPPAVLAAGPEPVEPRRPRPVLPGQVAGVGDAHASLLGGVDEEQPAEAPPGLTAEVPGRLLVHQRDPPPGGDQLRGRDQAGQPGPDHHDVGVHTSSSTVRRAPCGRAPPRYPSTHGYADPCDEHP